jgi:hypothetical protein
MSDPSRPSQPAQLSQFFHDLRAPLSRARTYAKLLADDPQVKDNELLEHLLHALDDLEARIRAEEGA